MCVLKTLSTCVNYNIHSKIQNGYHYDFHCEII